MNSLNIQGKLEEIVNKFNFIGQLHIYQDNKKIIDINTSENNFFALHKYSEIFINLLIIKGLEKNNISLESKLDLFIPEMNKSSKISFLNFLKDKSGLPDLHGLFSRKYQKEEFYLIMSDDEKVAYDLNFRNSIIPIDEVIEMYNQLELEHEPGTFFDESKAVQNIGPLIIERIYQKEYLNVLLENLLIPIGINPRNSDIKYRYYNSYPNIKKKIEITALHLYFALQINDIAKLYHKLKNGEIISQKNFRLMKKLTPFNGISFSESYSFTDHLSIFPFYIFDFKKYNIQIIHSTEFSGYELNINNDTYTFYNYYIPQLAPYFLKFQKPKLVKLNKNNVYDLLYIENNPDQLWFMGPTKYMLAYQYTEPNIKLYLLMDNQVTVGTITLYIDSKNNVYQISNVLIDAKYQGRGYGKSMIKEALKIFSKNKAKTISIYVDKVNLAAYKTYLSAGFILKNVFPTSYELIYTFN